MKKIIKTKRKSTPKLCWAEEVKFEFGGRFGGQKSLNISQSFLDFFLQKVLTGHNDTKIFTVHHINITYKCSFIKMSLSKKIKIENRPNNYTTTKNNN